MANKANSRNSDCHNDSKAIPIGALAGIAVSASVYVAWRLLRFHLERKKPFDALPMPPGNHFLFGHLLRMGGDFRKNHKLLTVDHANADGHTGFWIFGIPYVSVLNWRDAKTVLNTEYHRNASTLAARHIFKAFGRNSLLMMEGKEWKLHRSFVTRSFGASAVDRYRQVVVDTTDIFISTLSGKIEKESSQTSLQTDIQPLMKMITIDVFGKSALSINFENCNHLRPSPFALAFDHLSEQMTWRIRNPWNPACYYYSLPTKSNREQAKNFHFIRNMLADVIEKRRSAVTGTKFNDMLADMLEKADNSSKNDDLELSDEVLSDALMTLLFAGYDTTSTSLTYALYLLSQHPDVEETCVKEAVSVSDRTKYDELVYCQSVIMEALRLFPPAPTISRCVTERPIKLPGGLVLPKGISVLLPIYIIHRHEMNFAKPDEFRPDRWAKYDAASHRWVNRDHEIDDEEAPSIPAGNPNAFFAFSTGGRSCPGNKFALQEAVLVLSGLLRNFKFKAVEGYELKPARSGLLQRPKGGIPMIIQRRIDPKGR